MQKNKPHLATNHESMLVSLRTFQLTFTVINTSNCYAQFHHDVKKDISSQASPDNFPPKLKKNNFFYSFPQNYVFINAKHRKVQVCVSMFVCVCIYECMLIQEYGSVYLISNILTRVIFENSIFFFFSGSFVPNCFL